jgi:hypothetical protein
VGAQKAQIVPACSISKGFSFLNRWLIASIFHKIIWKFIKRFEQQIPCGFNRLKDNLFTFFENAYLISRNIEFSGEPDGLVTTFYEYYRCFHDFILLSKCRQAGVGKPVTGFVQQKSGFPGLARPGNKNGRKLLQGVAERRGKKAFDIHADKSKIEF